MTIQWYPGHMNTTRRLLAAAIPKKDVVIEVVDARMVRASQNPLLRRLRRDKPCLVVLTKADLADPAVTAAWLAYFEERRARERIAALAITTTQPGDFRAKIPKIARELVGRPKESVKPIRAVIVGIPNVGKSTLTNALLGRKVAKVGDKPAVTRAPQQVVLEGGMVLSDNAGILWPKIEDPRTTLTLALAGAVPDTVVDYETVGLFAADLLRARYPRELAARFKLDALPDTALATLESIGRKRGCVRAGGVVDLHKAADLLVHEVRAGLLGRLSFERPDDVAPRRAREAGDDDREGQASDEEASDEEQ